MKPSSLVAALALISTPAHAEMFSMTCYPKNSTPYTVTYNSVARQAAVTGGRTGFVRMYRVIDFFLLAWNRPGECCSCRVCAFLIAVPLYMLAALLVAWASGT